MARKPYNTKKIKAIMNRKQYALVFRPPVRRDTSYGRVKTLNHEIAHGYGAGDVEFWGTPYDYDHGFWYFYSAHPETSSLHEEESTSRLMDGEYTIPVWVSPETFFDKHNVPQMQMPVDSRGSGIAAQHTDGGARFR